MQNRKNDYVLEQGLPQHSGIDKIAFGMLLFVTFLVYCVIFIFKVPILAWLQACELLSEKNHTF